MKQSETVIQNFLKLGEQYGKNYGKNNGRVFPGRKLVVSKELIAQMSRDRLNGLTVKNIKDKYPALTIKEHQISNILNKNGVERTIIYRKIEDTSPVEIREACEESDDNPCIPSDVSEGRREEIEEAHVIRSARKLKEKTDLSRRVGHILQNIRKSNDKFTQRLRKSPRLSPS